MDLPRDVELEELALADDTEPLSANRLYEPSSCALFIADM